MQATSRRRYAAGLLAALGALCWQVPAQATQTYSGEATVVHAEVLAPVVNVNVVEVGPLPPQGGSDAEILASVNIPGVLNAGIAHAVTVGSGYWAFSQAEVADVDLGLKLATLATLTVSADVLKADTKAKCHQGGVNLSGKSVVTNLRVNLINKGRPIVITGAPNQTINVLNLAKIVINEQVVTGNHIEVNALHVTVLPLIPGKPLADVVISHAESDIEGCPTNPEPQCPDPNNPACPPVCPGDVRCACPNPLRTDCPVCPVKDFVTGGGYVLKTVNGTTYKVNFATHGGRSDDGSFRSSGFNVNDKSPGGPHIKDTSIFAYDGTGVTRTLGFYCNGTSNPVCTITVTDNGEPGTSDKWHLQSGGESWGSTSAFIAGGNIQLHKPDGCQAVSYGSAPPPPPPSDPPPPTCKGKKCR